MNQRPQISWLIKIGEDYDNSTTHLQEKCISGWRYGLWDEIGFSLSTFLVEQQNQKEKWNTADSVSLFTSLKKHLLDNGFELKETTYASRPDCNFYYYIIITPNRLKMRPHGFFVFNFCETAQPKAMDPSHFSNIYKPVPLTHLESLRSWTKHSAVIDFFSNDQGRKALISYIGLCNTNSSGFCEMVEQFRSPRLAIVLLRECLYTMGRFDLVKILNGYL